MNLNLHFGLPILGLFQWKQKGNAAYSSGDFNEAIEAYSAAIELSPGQSGLYSNRSAAYLMLGDFENALSDANKCILLQSESYKGYGRKGAVYYAMSKYERAIAVYKEGLKVCPDEKLLRVGLQAARRAKAQNSKASKSAKKTEIVTRAARRKSLQSSSTVSAFVQKTREELLLQKAQILSQLALIDDLEAMEDEAKLDLLFTLIDRDGDGTVDANELAAALRKRNKGLAVQESIEHAIKLVATHDVNGDAKLDLYEFKSCVYDMIKELGVSFGEFAEFLVFQINSCDETDDDAENIQGEEFEKAQEEILSLSTHQRMKELFILFDVDGSGELTFKEVAIGLYQITRNVEESTKAAMDLLLMVDKNDTRTLNYEQFCRLILAIVTTANSTFDEISDDLVSINLLHASTFKHYLTAYDLQILALSRNDEISPDDLAALTVADVIYETVREDKGSKKQVEGDVSDIISNLSYGRLKKLFDLWDVNHDGDITFSELIIGLQTFQDAARIDGDAEWQARAFLRFDSNGDNRLNQREFAEAMINYAKSFGVELHTLIDFMCVTNGMNGGDKDAFHRTFGMSICKDKSPIAPTKRLSLLFSDDEID